MSNTSKHWANAQERGSILGIRILLWIYRLFGRFVLSIFFAPVIFYFYLFGKTSRKASLNFLRRVEQHPEQQTFKTEPGFWQGYLHHLNFGWIVLDKIDSWIGKLNATHVQYADPDRVQAIMHGNKGAVFIGSHLGNIEACRAIASSKYNKRINVLVYTHHAVAFNRILNEINPDAEIDLIQVSTLSPELMMLLRERVDQGEIVVIVGDRTPVQGPGKIKYSTFLGEPAPFAIGPFVLASLLECPVYLLFFMKTRHAQLRYQMILEPFADPLQLPRKQRQEALQSWIDQYASRLEYHTIRYPYQWFNFYDFWAKDCQTERSSLPRQQS
ncbi:MAG: glycosyl transferase [Pseudomonadales bacterium]|nr:glycosyl transferase [Pseudomonadales bacterium]